MLDWLATYADPVLAAGGLVFVAALVPQVLHQRRVRECTVPLTTSVPTATTIAVFTLVFTSLGMWLTVAADLATVGLWAAIAVQRLAYGAPKEGSVLRSHYGGGRSTVRRSLWRRVASGLR